MHFRIRINGMKPVWASPGIYALNQRYECRVAFTGHRPGYECLMAFTGTSTPQIF